MVRFFIWPIGLLALVFLMYFAKGILVPLLLAILLAQLLVPLVARLDKRIPRFLAILLSLGVVGITIVLVLGLVGDQVTAFQKSAPDIQNRMVALLTSAQSFTSQKFGIDPVKQIAMLKQGLESLVGAGGQLAMTVLGFTVGLLGSATLIAILAFLMLYYREHIRVHLVSMISKAKGQDAAVAKAGESAETGESADFVDEILGVGQKYTAGLLSVIGIIGVLDSVGFLLMRAPFAILLGILGAIAVLIPYVGILVVAPACALLVWVVSGSALTALGVLGVYAVVHFMEGNVITPYLVGHQVNLNPLASILAVLIGGELWGPPGMLLFIPLIGMLVLTLSHVKGAEAFAGLLGSVHDADEEAKKAAQPKTEPFWRRLLPHKT